MRLVKDLLLIAGIVGLVYWINERRKGAAERAGEEIDRSATRAEEALHGVS